MTGSSTAPGESVQSRECPSLTVTDEGIESPDWLTGFEGTFQIRNPLVTGDMTTDGELPADFRIPGGIDQEEDPEEAYNPELCPDLFEISADGRTQQYALIDEREVRA